MTLCFSCCGTCCMCAIVGLAKWAIGWICGVIALSALAKSPVFQQLIRSSYDLKMKKFDRGKEKEEENQESKKQKK